MPVVCLYVIHCDECSVQCISFHYVARLSFPLGKKGGGVSVVTLEDSTFIAENVSGMTACVYAHKRKTLVAEIYCFLM